MNPCKRVISDGTEESVREGTSISKTGKSEIVESIEASKAQ